MNKAILYIFFLAGITLVSCSRKSIREVKSKEKYISMLKKIPDKKLEEQLQNDAAFLEFLADSVGTFEMYYMFSFGSGSDAPAKSAIDTAAAFRLPGRDTVLNDLRHPGRKLYFKQRPAVPESEFSFFPGRREQGFQNISNSKINYEVQKIFLKNKAIPISELKLRQADSILVNATYPYPTGFEPLSLKVGDPGPVVYEGHTIAIEILNSRLAEFSIPAELSASVIGNQGITSTGVPVKNNSYSNFPAIGIRPGVLEKIDALRNSLLKADKEAVIETLSGEEDSIFYYKNRLVDLLDELKAINERKESEGMDEMEIVFQLQEEYASLFAATKMMYRIAFPHEIGEVRLYLANAYDEVSRSFTAVKNYDYSGEIYAVYHDKEKNKYGISNAKGRIIIPAKYEKLKQSNNLYFKKPEKDKQLTCYLDVAKKKLISLPGEITTFHPLNDSLMAFEDKDRYVGVLDDHQKEIVPFQYDEAALHGNFLVMTGSRRGRKFYEFYGLDGRKIPMPEKITDYEASGHLIVVRNREGVNGVITPEGALVYPVKYNIDRILSDRRCSFVREESSGVFRGRFYGMIETGTGKEVLSPEEGYMDIGEFHDGLARVLRAKDFSIQEGFINEQGEVVIPVQFDTASDFYKGHAVVKSAEHKIYLIDTRGTVVKEFPEMKREAKKKWGNYFYIRREDGMFFYEVNGAYYDYQGEPLHLPRVRSQLKTLWGLD